MKYDQLIQMLNSEDIEMRQLGQAIISQKTRWTHWEYLHVYLQVNDKFVDNYRAIQEIRLKHHESWRNS